MSDRISSLRIDTERRGRDAVVRLRGSVSIAEADSLRETMESLASEQPPRIVLVLSEMDFICSAGLGAIISGHVRSRHHNGRICLVDPTAPVRQMLETTRLTRLFGIYQTVDEALTE